MLIENLENQSGISKSKLLYLAATASKRYKIYDIPKRNGGHRRIAHPSRALKAVQRWISKVLISEFPIHQCATAYKKGSNIRQNALRHAQTNFTLRMDFQNFFPSFSMENIQDFVREQNGRMNLRLSPNDLEFVASILTRNGFVTIGAPSSPSITNAIMCEFDKHIFDIASKGDLIYTRYADDLFISARAPDLLEPMNRQVAIASADFPYANLRVNHRKTAYLSRRYRRSVTGLVITPDGNISIGRARKREIKSMVHRYIVGKIERDGVERTRGLVAFTKGTDAGFFAALQRKYGEDTIDGLLGRR